MSSSSYTSNLSLSQFDALDKPSWIQDYNSDMSKIDGACKNFTGTDGSTAGSAGFVPAPATTDADKFLKSDGTWAEAGGSSITLYTTYGQKEDGAMTQKATTNLVYYEANPNKIRIGNGNVSSSNTISIGGANVSSQYSIGIGSAVNTSYNQHAIAIGDNSKVSGSDHNYAVALGANAECSQTHSVALGSYSKPRAQGVVDVMALSGSTKYGYQGTNDATRTEYRVISGVHDGEDDHDAMTVGQVKTLAYKLVTVDPSQANTPADFIGQIAIYYEEPQTGIKQLRGRFMCTVIDISQPQQPVYIWSTMN